MPVTAREIQDLLDQVKVIVEMLEAMLAELKLAEKRTAEGRGVAPRPRIR